MQYKMKKTSETRWTKLISVRLEWETMNGLSVLTTKSEYRDWSFSDLLRKAVEEFLEREEANNGLATVSQSD